MHETNNSKREAELRKLNAGLHKLSVKIAKACMRLAEPDRQRVMLIIEDFSTGKTSTATHRYPWSKADIERCYLQLQPISQKIANDFRRWASEYRETEYQFRLAMIAKLERRKRKLMSAEIGDWRVPHKNFQQAGPGSKK